jgi:hypothetical protein
MAKHPEAQARIREEIALVRAKATGPGEEFTIADLNSMVYTLATLKVEFVLVCFLFLLPLRRSAGIYEARSHQLDQRQDSDSG